MVETRTSAKKPIYTIAFLDSRPDQRCKSSGFRSHLYRFWIVFALEHDSILSNEIASSVIRTFSSVCQSLDSVKFDSDTIRARRGGLLYCMCPFACHRGTRYREKNHCTGALQLPIIRSGSLLATTTNDASIPNAMGDLRTGTVDVAGGIVCFYPEEHGGSDPPRDRSARTRLVLTVDTMITKKYLDKANS